MAVPSRQAVSPLCSVYQEMGLEPMEGRGSSPSAGSPGAVTHQRAPRGVGARTVPEREGGEPTGVEGFDEKLLLV